MLHELSSNNLQNKAPSAPQTGRTIQNFNTRAQITQVQVQGVGANGPDHHIEHRHQQQAERCCKCIEWNRKNKIIVGIIIGFVIVSILSTVVTLYLIFSPTYTIQQTPTRLVFADGSVLVLYLISLSDQNMIQPSVNAKLIRVQSYSPPVKARNLQQQPEKNVYDHLIVDEEIIVTKLSEDLLSIYVDVEKLAKSNSVVRSLQQTQSTENAQGEKQAEPSTETDNKQEDLNWMQNENQNAGRQMLKYKNENQTQPLANFRQDGQYIGQFTQYLSSQFENIEQTQYREQQFVTLRFNQSSDKYELQQAQTSIQTTSRLLLNRILYLKRPRREQVKLIRPALQSIQASFQEMGKQIQQAVQRDNIPLLALKQAGRLATKCRPISAKVLKCLKSAIVGSEQQQVQKKIKLSWGITVNFNINSNNNNRGTNNNKKK